MRNFVRQDVYGKYRARERKCRKYTYRLISLSLSLSQSYFIDDLSTAYAVVFQRHNGEVERVWMVILLIYFKALHVMNKEPVQLLLGSRSVGCGLDS